MPTWKSDFFSDNMTAKLKKDRQENAGNSKANQTCCSPTSVFPALPRKHWVYSAICFLILFTSSALAQTTLYSHNFNSGTNGWTGSGGFNRGTNGNFNSGSSGNYWYTTSDDEDGYAESPVFSTVGYTNLQLSLSIRYNTGNANLSFLGTYYEGMNVAYSANGGGWQVLGAVGEGTNWYNNTDVDGFSNGTDGWTGNNGSWTTATISLPAELANLPNLRFRVQFGAYTTFLGTDVNSAGVAFDNFALTGTPPSVSVTVSPASVLEDGASNLVYTFTRNPSSSSALTVNFNVGGTATFNTDYTQSGAATFNGSSGTISIPANATTASVTINPTADTDKEPDETVQLTVTSGTGYSVGTPSSATGAVTADDGVISGIVNEYAAISGVNGAVITVTNPPDISGWQAGDKVLIMQMKGTVIDQSNSPSYGDIIGFDGAGNYEYNTIASISGANITLDFSPCKPYNLSHPVQIIRVPVYTDIVLNNHLTGQPWNGTTGGVIAIEVTGTLTLNANIDAAGLGFRGGDESSHSVEAAPTVFVCDIDSGQGGIKGEGIIEIPDAACRGKLANGGGGGNDHNSGGGGGGNYGAGGQGGDGWPAETGEGGVGGISLAEYYTSGLPRLFLGGGGGGGHQNNGATAAASNGGGLVFLTANTINAAVPGVTISAKAPDAPDILINDGAGGGGAGGSILLDVQNYVNPANLTLDVSGGDGASLLTAAGHGPGGGGGGGFIHTNAQLPAGITTDVSGGQPGIFTSSDGSDATSGTSRNATAGSPGIILQGNLAIQICSAPPTLDLDSNTAGVNYSTVYHTGTPATPIAANVAISDPDDANIEIAVIVLENPLDGGSEYLMVDDPAAILSAYNINVSIAGSGHSVTLKGSSSLANYQAVIAMVKYVNTQLSPDESNRTISVTLNDGGAESNRATTTVDVIFVNTVPAIDLDADNSSGAIGNDFSTTFLKGGAPVAVADSDLSITDATNTHLESLTLQLSNRPNGSNESLSVNGSLPAGISVGNSYDNSDGILELSGSATLTSYQTALGQIVYNNASVNPTPATRTITVKVNDGSVDSNIANALIGVKYPPVLTAIGPVETTLEETEVEIDFLEVSNNSDASDADGSVTAFVVKSVNTGTLRIGTTPDTATPYAAGSNDVISGSLKAFWTPAINAIGTISAFTVAARDNEGFESLTTKIVPVVVEGLNDLPVAVDDNGATNQETAVTLADILLNDSDADGYLIANSITLIDPGNSLNTGNRNSPLTITNVGEFSIDAVGNLTFSPVAGFSGNAEVNYTVNDDLGGVSNVATVTIAVSGNTPPVIDLDPSNSSGASGADFKTSFLIGSVGALIVNSDVEITDATDTQLESLTVILTNRPDGINEQLQMIGTLPPGITIAKPYSVADGTLILSGSADLDDYQNALKLIKYVNVASTMDASNRVITVLVNDGTADSNTATCTISPGCASYPQFSFIGPSLISGTGGQVGAVYRFPNIDTPANTLDALVEITGKSSNVTLDNIDYVDATQGYDTSFQPLIRATSGGEMYFDLRSPL